MAVVQTGNQRIREKKNQDNKITTHNSIRMRTTEKHTKTQRPKINGNNNNI